MKNLFFIIVAFCLSFPTAAEDLPRPVFRFPKEIPADKGDVLAERILGNVKAMRSVDYGALKKYWSTPGFDDGLLTVDYYGFKRSDTTPEGHKIVPYKYNFSVRLGLLDKKRIKKEGWAGWAGSSDSTMVGFFHEPFAGFYSVGESQKCRVNARVRPGETEFASLKLEYKGTQATYKWDEEGQFTFEGDADILLKKWQIPELQTLTTTVPKIDWGTIPRIPNTKDDKNLQTFFERMKQLMSARKFDEFALLLDLPIECLVEKGSPVSGSITGAHFLINNWKCQWGSVSGGIENKDTKKRITFAFARDTQGMPTLYLEGDVEIPDGIVSKLPVLSASGRGIEVRFHDNGSPSYYRSLVRGRLYGRQIEWNDRGRITSDVDLDIPKEIKEKKWFPSIF